MKLNESKIKSLKPRQTAYKVGDGDGLYLFVKPTGQKYWRMKCFHEGKEIVLSFGPYPEITLGEAREKRFQARKLLANGTNPAAIMREQKRQKELEDRNSFQHIALEWHEKKTGRWSAYYAKQVKQRLEKDVFPKIGHKAITSITAKDVLQMAQAIEQRDALEIAHRAVQICSKVFQYALVQELVENNPAAALRGALKSTPPKQHHAYLRHNDLPDFLQKLEMYDGSIQTQMAMKLLLLTFVRSNEVCGARWSEIDFERQEWRIPAARMKRRVEHIVPLSSQAVQLLRILHKMNGQREHVFPSTQSPRKCITSNTLLYALYTIGYKDKATIHGFRATASTILNESGLFERDAIERQLAHMERNRIRAAYDHAEHLPLRRQMMAWWADYLDSALATSKKKQLDAMAC